MPVGGFSRKRDEAFWMTIEPPATGTLIVPGFVFFSIWLAFELPLPKRTSKLCTAMSSTSVKMPDVAGEPTMTLKVDEAEVS